MKGRIEKPHDMLASRLRSEAMAWTPEFSPEVHARAMAVLRANGLKGLTADPEEIFRARWRIAARVGARVAVAAAFVVAAWVVLALLATPPADQPIAGFPAMDPTDLIKDVAGNVGLPEPDAADQDNFDSLDRDAQRLAIFVADQLPMFGLADDAPQTPSPQ